MAPHGKELSNDLKETIILRHQKGDGYKKISNAVHIYKQEYQSQSGAKLQEERECNGCVTTSWHHVQHAVYWGKFRRTGEQVLLTWSKLLQTSAELSCQLRQWDALSKNTTWMAVDLGRSIYYRQDIRRPVCCSPMPMSPNHSISGRRYCDLTRQRSTSSAQMSSRNYDADRMRNTRTSVWCPQWSMVAEVSWFGEVWVHKA